MTQAQVTLHKKSTQTTGITFPTESKKTAKEEGTDPKVGKVDFKWSKLGKRKKKTEKTEI